jgi:hypothetical protein
MKTLRMIAMSLELAAALAASSAQAGYHHICFEGVRETDNKGVIHRVVIAACEDDAGAACSFNITKLGGSAGANQVMPIQRQPLDLYPAAAGAYREVRFHAFDFDVQVDFSFDGNIKRRCTLRQATSTPPLGQLRGFSTDASGLATTGVWRYHAVGGWSPPQVPGDFVAVGGGTAVVQPDAFIRRTDYGSGPGGTWTSWAETDTLQPAASTIGYVIGLRIGDMSRADMLSKLVLQSARSARPDVVADATQGVNPPPTVLMGPAASVLGGGIFAAQTIRGHVAAASVPTPSIEWLVCLTRQGPLSLCPRPAVGGWHVESKDPWGQTPDIVESRMATLPLTMTVTDPVKQVTNTWRLRVATVQMHAAPDLAPAALATGLRGDYAVTGAGAEIDWRSATGGNAAAAVPLLAGIEPRPDLGGASAWAQPGTLGTQAAPASLTTHAVGLKLVDAKTDAEMEAPPKLISSRQFCLADGRLRDTELCQRLKPLVLPPWQVCQFNPYLEKYGYCAP